jgi:hypothetical protein
MLECRSLGKVRGKSSSLFCDTASAFDEADAPAHLRRMAERLFDTALAVYAARNAGKWLSHWMSLS